MRVNDNGIYRDETPEEITKREAWEKGHPVSALVAPIEDRVADLELMLADLIGGAV